MLLERGHTCRTDVDDFEACVASASDPPPGCKPPVALQEGFRYKGGFWRCRPPAGVESVRLKRYIFLVKPCRLLASRRPRRHRHDLPEPWHIPTTRAALPLCPLLVALERYRDALSAYEDCAKFFFDELGIEPSERLKECRKKIADKMPGGMVSVTEIKETLNHDDNGPGAYFANYLNFLENYRYAIRVVKRNRMSAFLMFCSLTDRSGLPLPDSEKLQEAANVLQNAIKASLRSGDLYTRYDRANFVVLLVGINQENCPMVPAAPRALRASYRSKNVQLQFKFISAARRGRRAFDKGVSKRKNFIVNFKSKKQT